MAGKVLVTGAKGFIGSNLVKALDAKGYDVRATAVTRPVYLKDDKLGHTEFVPSNMTDADSLKRVVEGVERVYHTAAIFNFYDDEALMQRVNAQGTDDLARTAKQAGVNQFINWSSGAIYGTGYGNEPATEEHEPQPNDKYTRSKWAQEQAALAYNSEVMQVLNLRPAAVYGPGSDYGDARALYLLKRGVLCVIPGFSDHYASHIHIEDVVGAAIHLSEDPANYAPDASNPSRAAINIADDIPVSSKALLKTASPLIANKGLIGFIPIKVPVFPVRMLAWILETWSKLSKQPPLIERDAIDYIAAGHAMSNDKLTTAGYKLKHPEITDCIPELVEWYEKNEWQVFK